LPPETLYKSLFQLVPGACLFTIVAEPELTENQLDSYDQSTAVGGALGTVDNNEKNCDDAHVLGDVQSSVLSSNEHANAMNSDSTMVTEQAVSLQNSTQTEATSREAVNVVRSDMVNGDQANLTCDQTREMAASIINSELGSNETTLPIPLLPHFKEKPKIITEKDLCTIAQHLYFSITAEESCAIERGTQHQREYQNWFNHCEGRLTASSFHSIWTLQAQTKPENLLQRLLDHKDISHIPALQWGIDNESRAYVEKVSSSHIDFTHLGASADGFVYCSCHSKGIIEIISVLILQRTWIPTLYEENPNHV